MGISGSKPSPPAKQKAIVHLVPFTREKQEDLYDSALNKNQNNNGNILWSSESRQLTMQRIRNLQPEDVLYIYGHGSAKNSKWISADRAGAERLDYQGLAKELEALGLSTKWKGKIKIRACESAASNWGYDTMPLGSFAYLFGEALAKLGYSCQVWGYKTDISVSRETEGTFKGRFTAEMQGSKSRARDTKRLAWGQQQSPISNKN